MPKPMNNKTHLLKAYFVIYSNFCYIAFFDTDFHVSQAGLEQSSYLYPSNARFKGMQYHVCLIYRVILEKNTSYVCKLSTFSNTYFTYEHILLYLIEDKTKCNLNILI